MTASSMRAPQASRLVLVRRAGDDDGAVGEEELEDVFAAAPAPVATHVLDVGPFERVDRREAHRGRGSRVERQTVGADPNVRQDAGEHARAAEREPADEREAGHDRERWGDPEEVHARDHRHERAEQRAEPGSSDVRKRPTDLAVQANRDGAPARVDAELRGDLAGGAVGGGAEVDRLAAREPKLEAIAARLVDDDGVVDRVDGDDLRCRPRKSIRSAAVSTRRPGRGARSRGARPAPR